MTEANEPPPPEAPDDDAPPAARPGRGFPILVLVSGAAAALGALAIVTVLAVDVPRMDDWTRFGIVWGEDGSWPSLGALWEPENDHRVFVPRLITSALARLSAFDPRAELTLQWVLLALVIGIMASLAPRGRRLVLAALAAALLFTPHGWRLWTWAATFNNALCMICALGSLALLGRAACSPRAFVTALLLAVAASWSFLAGFLVWPAAALLIATGSGHRLWRASAWLLAVGVATALHVLTLPEPADAMSQAAPSLVEVASFMARLVGAGLIGRLPGVAQVTVGIVGILLAILALGIEARRADTLPGGRFRAALALFALMVVAAIAWGRAGNPGTVHAESPRFAAFGALVWLAGLGWMVVRPMTTAMRHGITAILLLAIGTCALSLGEVRSSARELAEARSRLVNERALGMDQVIALFGPKFVGRLARFAEDQGRLRRAGWSYAREMPVPAGPLPPPLGLALSRSSVDGRHFTLLGAHPGAFAALVHRSGDGTVLPLDQRDADEKGQVDWVIPAERLAACEEELVGVSIDSWGRLLVSPALPVRPR